MCANAPLAAFVAAVMLMSGAAMASMPEIERHQYTPKMARMAVPDCENASVDLLSLHGLRGSGNSSLVDRRLLVSRHASGGSAAGMFPHGLPE